MEMHIQEQAISKTIVLNFVRRCYCGLVGLVSLCYCAFAVVSCIQNIYWSVICGPQSFFWQVLCGTESFFWWLFCGPNIFSCECFVGPIFFFSWVLFGPEKFALRLKIFFRDQFLRKAGTRLCLKLCFLSKKILKASFTEKIIFLSL